MIAAAATALALAVAAGPVQTVQVRDDVFSRTSLTVKKGTTVKWVWRGEAPHNVTVTKGPKVFRSTTQTRGTYKRKLKRRGTYELLCTVHSPDMTMRLKVR